MVLSMAFDATPYDVTRTCAALASESSAYMVHLSIFRAVPCTTEETAAYCSPESSKVCIAGVLPFQVYAWMLNAAIVRGCVVPVCHVGTWVLESASRRGLFIASQHALPLSVLPFSLRPWAAYASVLLLSSLRSASLPPLLPRGRWGNRAGLPARTLRLACADRR